MWFITILITKDYTKSIWSAIDADKRNIYTSDMKVNLFFQLAFVFISLSFLYTSFTSLVYATEETTEYSGITPDKPFRYSLKRAGEKVTTIFLSLFNKKGLGNFEVDLLVNRAKELFYIAENKDLTLMETTVSRYITQTGLVIEQFEAKSISSEKILSETKEWQVKFEKYRDNFPSQSAMWLLLQQAADSTKGLESQIQEK